jgi:hypothetical protein
MNNMDKDKDIFEVFDIEPMKNITPDLPTSVPTNPVPVVITQESDHDSFNADFEEARRNMIYLIETAKTALEDVHVIAKEKEGAKEYEALNQLLRTVGDASGNLMKLHQARKKFKETSRTKDEMNNGIAVGGNAVFVGSSSELRKLLKNNNTD